MPPYGAPPYGAPQYGAPAAAPPPAEKPAADKPPEEKDDPRDAVHLRGGFSVNGGVMFLPAVPGASSLGPAFGFGGRIGVQINRWVGIVYQNTPIVTLTPQHSGSGTSSTYGFKAGFADYNSFMAMLSVLHMLDIGVGPSVDFLAVANGSAALSGTASSSSSGVSAGAHGRVALNIGGLTGSSFAIGFDAHPLFTGAGKGVSLTLGLGAEWQ